MNLPDLPRSSKSCTKSDKCKPAVLLLSGDILCKLMLSRIFMSKLSKRAKALPEILTLAQTCEVLNCHPNTLRNWDRRGVLTAIRFGTRKDRRYKKSDVFKLIES